MGSSRNVLETKPMMIAWKEYEKTESYENSIRWCGEHSKASLQQAFWAAYIQ